MKNRYLVLGVTALLAACSSDAGTGDDPVDGTPPEPGPSGDTTPESEALPEPGLELAGCERGRIEPDFVASPLLGAAIEAGGLAPGEYLISSTYLRLGQDAASQQLFEALVAPIVADLQTRAGLLALSLGTSAGCGTARTLAVWQDEVAMLGFVTGEAHASAMARIADVSRGGSSVTHWIGDESSIEWPQAAVRLGADDGPFY